MEPLGPLQHRSVVDEACAALRARILHGVWPVGARLPTEHQLASTLGVGRSTVREALARLVSAGLLSAPRGASKRVRDARSHGGLEILSELVVSPDGEVDLGVVRSIAEARAAIAPDVARLAALRRTESQAATLCEHASVLCASSPLDRLLEQTLRWWTVLVHASDNLAYRLAYNTLRATHVEGRAARTPLLEGELRATSLYGAVAAAVRSREPEAAARHCRALIAPGTEALLTITGATPCS